MRRKLNITNTELDLTPMIDVVFLLISFFTLVINFTAADMNERIKLPSSELAKPPEVPPVEPLILHVLPNGNVIFANADYNLAGLQKPIAAELRLFQYMKVPLDKVTVIIRADADAQSGQVLDVIEFCQKLELTNFILRAKQDENAAH